MQLACRTCGLLIALLLCAGVCSAVPFSYSINCPQMNAGPDAILPFTQSGTVDLPPNTTSTNNTIDFYNATTQVNRSNTNATFNLTLSCSFTLGGVVTQVNRPFTLVVTENMAVGAQPAEGIRPEGIAFGSETHTYTFQPYSFTVIIPGQGTVAVSGGTQVDGTTLAPTAVTLVFIAPAIPSNMLFTPLPVNTVPLPPSIILTLTGLGGAAMYEVRRRKMLALRR